MKQGRKISNRENRKTPRSSGFSEGSDLAQRSCGLQQLWSEVRLQREGPSQQNPSCAEAGTWQRSRQNIC